MLRSKGMKLWLAICEEGVMLDEARVVEEGEEEEVEEEGKGYDSYHMQTM